MKSLVKTLLAKEPKLQYYIIPTHSFMPEEVNSFVNHISGGTMYILNADELQMINADDTIKVEDAVEDSEDPFLEVERMENINEDDPGEDNKEELIEFLPDSSLINAENTDNVADTQKLTFNHRNFVCVFCNESFPNANIYKDHMQQHYKNSKVFRCETCQSSFNSEINYNVHLACHLGSGDKLVCPICSRNFHRVASLRCHLNIHREDETFTCILCLQEFISQDDFTKHIEWHRKDIQIDEVAVTATVLVCPDCKYVFDNPEEYKSHVAKHSELKKIIYKGKRTKKRNASSGKVHKYKCNTCDKSFMKPSLLKRHMRIHTGDRPFKCSLCHLAFGQKVTLRIHLLKHTGFKPYQCCLCNANFTQKGNLRAHMEKTHTATRQNEKVYRCSQCTCIFKRVASLNGHITKVHGEKIPVNNANSTIKQIFKEFSELPQDIYNEATSNSKSNRALNNVINIISHISIANMSEYPLETISHVRLTDSSAGIKNMRQYEIKVRTFGDIKYYCCKYCRKEFKKPSDLIRHMRVHTGEKPFKCDRCGMNFSLRSTLQQHASTHFGRRDRECFICHKRLRSVRTMKAHLRRHLQDPVNKSREYFKCNICGKGFTNAERVNKHLVTHEQMDDSIKVVLMEPLVHTENGLTTVSAVTNRPLPIPQPPIPPPCSRPQADSNLPPASPGAFACANCSTSFNRFKSLQKHIDVFHAKRPKRNKLPSPAIDGFLNSSDDIKENVQMEQTFIASTIEVDQSDNTLSPDDIILANKHNSYRNPEKFIPPKECITSKKKGRKRGRKWKIKGPSQSRKSRIKHFSCEFCGKTCASLYHLRQHINFHTQTKNYQCHMCEKRFVTASILRRHFISHSYEKPYIYPYCKRSFKLLVLCRNHIESHRVEVFIQLRQDKIQNSLVSNLDVPDALSNNSLKLPYVGSFISIANVITTSSASSTLPPLHTVNALHNKFCRKLLFPVKEFMDFNLDSEKVNVDEMSLEVRVKSGRGRNLKNKMIKREDDDDNTTVRTKQINLENNKNAADSNGTAFFLSPEKLQRVFIQNNLETVNISEIKLQNSDPLFISSVNDPEQNILYPIYPNTSAQGPEDIQQFETYNPNLIFNGTVPMHDINIADDSDKIESTSHNVTLPNIGEVSIEFQPNIKQSVINLRNLPLNLSAVTNANPKHDIFVKIAPADATINLSSLSSICDKKETVQLNQISNDAGFYKPAEFVCPSCKGIYNGLDALEAHNCRPLGSAINTEDKDKKALKSRSATIVGEHFLVPSHSKAKPTFTCYDCKLKFSSKRELAKHKEKEGHKTVNDKRNKCTCEICGKVFGKVSDLLRHSRIHSGEKPFQCPECSKSFTIKSTLASHMRTHDTASSKSFICNVCNKTVSCQSSLNVHMLIHTGEKPQSCPICNERFRTVSRKRLHIQNVHVNNNARNNNKNKKISNILQSLVMETNEDILKEQAQEVENISLTGQTIQLNLTTASESVQSEEMPSFLPLSNIADQLTFEPNLTETIPIDPVFLHELQVNGILTKDGELSPLYRIQYEFDRANGRILSITPVDQTDENQLEFVNNAQIDEAQLEVSQMVDGQEAEESEYQNNLVVEQAPVDLEYEEDVLRNFMPMIEIIAREDQDVFTSGINKNSMDDGKRGKTQDLNQKMLEFKTITDGNKDKVRDFQHNKTRMKENKIKVLKEVIIKVGGDNQVILQEEINILDKDEHAEAANMIQLPEVENQHEIIDAAQCRLFLESKSQGLYNCPDCKRKFQTRSGLTKHKRIHGRGDYPCPSCSRRFRNEQLLDEHRRMTHEGLRPFPCPYCDNSFQRESNRKVHIKRIHRVC